MSIFQIKMCVFYPNKIYSLGKRMRMKNKKMKIKLPKNTFLTST